jgi:adenylyltransferase/sulfurtransferase
MQSLELDDYDRVRYNRQMLLDGWGEAGQRRIKNASVFIAGAGGLGSPVSMYLTAAGVGKIRLCDADTIELSNLNRQILHSDNRLRQLKAFSAERTLSAVNPSISIDVFTEYLEQDNAERIIGTPDLIVDCLDNYATRYLLNTYCIKHHIPLVHAAVWGLMGQLSFIDPPETPCLRCIFPEAPPKGVFPVLGATPGVIGSLQAMETLKFLTGVGDLLKGKLLLFDGEDMSLTMLNLKHLPGCPDCGGGA